MSGRPTVVTQKVVRLLVTCFHNGLTVRQACWQSGISHEAYYQRLREDAEFSDIMAKAQDLPYITAKINIVTAIKKGDLSASKWWLDRKAREEFGSIANRLNPGDSSSEPGSEILHDSLAILEDHAKIEAWEISVRKLAKERNMQVFGSPVIPPNS
jgi:hypothetical protein